MLFASCSCITIIKLIIGIKRSLYLQCGKILIISEKHPVDNFRHIIANKEILENF